MHCFSFYIFLRLSTTKTFFLKRTHVTLPPILLKNMTAALDVVRAEHFIRKNADCIMGHSGLNGLYRRTEAMCNGRYVYEKCDNGDTLLWWSNKNGAMSWCIGPRSHTQASSNKIWALAPGSGLHPTSTIDADWRVFCYFQRAWITQKEAEITEQEAARPLTRSPTCTICRDSLSTYAVIPCGHLCLCDLCFRKGFFEMTRCPICRGKMNQIMRVYT